MEKLEFEILSKTVNCPVVRFPGRAFPGILIQGDSVKNLNDLAAEIAEEAQKCSNEELLYLSRTLNEKLKEYLDHYESTLRENNIDLPYSRPSN